MSVRFLPVCSTEREFDPYPFALIIPTGQFWLSRTTGSRGRKRQRDWRAFPHAAPRREKETRHRRRGAEALRHAPLPRSPPRRRCRRRQGWQGHRLHLFRKQRAPVRVPHQRRVRAARGRAQGAARRGGALFMGRVAEGRARGRAVFRRPPVRLQADAHRRPRRSHGGGARRQAARAGQARGGRHPARRAARGDLRPTSRADGPVRPRLRPSRDAVRPDRRQGRRGGEPRDARARRRPCAEGAVMHARLRILASRLAVVVVAVVVVAMAGCAVDQAKEVETYRKVIDIPTTAPAADFTSGQPLTVRRALLLANASNEQLSIEGENYLQALIERRRAVAAFLPTVSLAPRYVFRERTASGGGGDEDDRGGSSSEHRTFDLPVSATANLFNGFSDLARLRNARLTSEQRRSLLLDLQEQFLLDVARVFYQVLRSEESVTVLDNSLKVQEERLRDVRGRQAAGVVRPLDVAQVEAQASQTRVSLFAARSDVVNGRSVLAFLTAADVTDSPLVEEFDVPEITDTREQMRTIGAQRRHDLEAAAAATRAARQLVEAAFGQYYPSVTVDLNVFLYRESTPSDRDWEGLLRANIPLFSAGLIHADVRTAWSEFRQASLAESLARRQVVQDVDIAHQDLTATARRLAEAHTQLTAAEAAFKQADQSNRIGLATNLERLIAQDQLLTAQLQYVSQQFERKLAYLNLLRATGSLRSVLETIEAEAATTTRPTTTTTPTTREAVSSQLSAISQKMLE